jgi:hypothetical protein
MTLKRSIGFGCGFVGLVVATLLVLPSAASAKGGKGGAAAVVIDSVQIFELQAGAKRFEILGGGFDNGAFVAVGLDDGTVLNVLDASSTHISAKTQPNIADGDYTMLVSTGSLNKQNAETPIHLGGTLHVVCLDWYLTTGPDHHIHVEGFVQDENGDPVIGAAVTLENTVDGELYQIYNTTTFKYAGYNHGESCPLEVAQASGATGQACCIGGATDPPTDSRSCNAGLYEALVISVQPPSGSDREWDGETPANSFQFDEGP